VLREKNFAYFYATVFVYRREQSCQREKRNPKILKHCIRKNKKMAAYIKFDGVDGESKDKDHKGWVDILSFSQAIHQPGGGSTGVARRRGDVVLDDVRISKLLDKSSPKIAEAVCKGKVFPKVVIELTASYTDAGRVTYYKYELKNVLVTSYNVSGAGQSDDVPSEDFSLNFEEIKVTYTENDSAGKKKGNIEYSWKVEEGEA
jgi:type VI secretion system secreted protein Hcp